MQAAAGFPVKGTAFSGGTGNKITSVEVCDINVFALEYPFNTDLLFACCLCLCLCLCANSV